jgi:ABC-type sugar transport system substrate-binding protein
MNLRSIAATAAVLISAAALLSACGGDDSPSGTGGTDAAVVGVDYPRSDTDFWNSYIKYTPQFADELGLELKTTNSQNDVAKLTSNVQSFISQGVKGIAMAPQDTAAIAPALQSLATKKIPVVTIDTRPDQGEVFMVVRADNRAYGEKACKFLGATASTTHRSHGGQSGLRPSNRHAQTAVAAVVAASTATWSRRCQSVAAPTATTAATAGASATV